MARARSAQKADSNARETDFLLLTWKGRASNFLSQPMLRSREAGNSYERKQEKITVTTMLQGDLFEGVFRGTAVVKSRFKALELQTVNMWPDGAMSSETAQEDQGAMLPGIE